MHVSDAEIAEEWTKYIYPKLLESYTAENIYCVCRFSVNIQSNSDEQIEVFICTNLTGTDKKNVLALKDTLQETVPFLRSLKKECLSTIVIYLKKPLKLL